MQLLKRNSCLAMFVILVVFLVASRATAQEQVLSTMTPSPNPNYPLLDMFTGASSYYPDATRKNYREPLTLYSRLDALTSFATAITSIAKIMFSAIVILFLKFFGGTLMLLPLTLVLFAKVGLKVFLLWPMMARIIKYIKHKKKKHHHHHKGRSLEEDCSDRMACIIETASQGGWASNLGAAATFSLIDEMEPDTPLAKTLLTVLAGDKVAHCMSLNCTSGIESTTLAHT